jgi:hypothetical protein
MAVSLHQAGRAGKASVAHREHLFRPKAAKGFGDFLGKRNRSLFGILK